MHAPAPGGSVVAPHGGLVEIVAITPDGQAALTSDELGGHRLWPTLDGSHEPVVVQMPAARELAISRHQGGYSLVALDGVGGIVVSTLDGAGHMTAHTTLPVEPGFLEIVSTDVGVLAWRKDQKLVLLDADGATHSQLTTEAGQHVVAIAVSGKVAIAAIETAADVRRVRALSLEPKLAWGKWLDAGPRVGTELAVSPNGHRIASIDVTTDGTRKVVVLDLSSKGTLDLEHDAGDATELAFLDDDHLMLAGPSMTTMTDLKAKAAAVPLPGPSTGVRAPQSVIAVARGVALVGFDGELQVVKSSSTQYLGYDLAAPPIVETAGSQLLVGLGTTFMLLDHMLEIASAPTVPLPAGLTVAELRWLGGSEWIALASKEDGATSLVLVDVVKRTHHVVRSGLTSVPLLMHDPSTHLITLSLGNAPELDHFDPTTHTVDKLAAIPKSKTYEQVELVPVSPRLAAGAQLMLVTMRDRVTIQWIHDPRALDKVSASVTVVGSLAATDAAGHAYLWRSVSEGKLDLAVYGDGKLVGTLPTDGPVGLWPDPTGTRVVEVGARAIALYTLDGKLVWNDQIASTTEARWLDNETIAVISAAGIARLDARTGAVMTARCGWRFGLSTKPHPPGPRIEPLCTQLAH